MISIIVPIYNTEKYLHECIDSILAQTYSDFELLLIDDGSTDKSSEMCDEYAPKDNRIKVFHKANGGVSSARNVGIDNAQGEWICFVDSDDWLEPEAIQKLVQKQIETDADIVSGNAMKHYCDRQELLKAEEYATNEDMILKMVELTIDHVLWRRLIKKSLFTDNNIRFIEGIDIGEDHYTLPRLIYYANKCVTVDEVVYHYNRMNPLSYTQVNTWERQAKKKISDYSSLNYLLDFFDGKNTNVHTKIKEIKKEVIKKRMKIVLSVIIPVCENNELSLRRCLSNLVIQDEKNACKLEAIIVIDKGCGYSLEIAQEYEKQFPSTFHVVSSDKDDYSSYIKCGLDFATGKYVRILDSCDFLDNEMLIRYLNTLETVDANLVINDTGYIDREGNILKQRIHYLQENKKIIVDAITPIAERLNIRMVAYSTECLRQIVYFQEGHLLYDNNGLLTWPLINTNTVFRVSYPLYIEQEAIQKHSNLVYSCDELSSTLLLWGKTWKNYNGYQERKEWLYCKFVKEIQWNYNTFIKEHRYTDKEFRELDKHLLLAFPEMEAITDVNKETRLRYEFHLIPLWRKHLLWIYQIACVLSKIKCKLVSLLHKTA